MAKSYRAQQLAVQRKYRDRLLDDLRMLAIRVGTVIQRFAIGPTPAQRTIPNTRAARERLSRAVWAEAIRPYFIGTGDEPYTNAKIGVKPTIHSDFMRLIDDGVNEAVGIEADRHIGIVQKYASQDRVVLNWLTGPRPIREIGPSVNWYDPYHLFVYEKKGGGQYTLSDAVWDTAESTRESIDRLLSFYISDGTAAVDIADILEPFLTTGEKGRKTPKPYGDLGSYSARRLARTEITAAAGRSFKNAAMVNPWVRGIKWNLSPSHPEVDICDNYSSGGNGSGEYAFDNLPTYPAHPHCLCYLTNVLVSNPAEVTRQLRAEIDAAQTASGLSNVEAMDIRRGVENRYFDVFRVQGAFSQSYMKNALTYGEWIAKVMRTESFL